MLGMALIVCFRILDELSGNNKRRRKQREIQIRLFETLEMKTFYRVI
jgi:hypothetical protein